MKSPVTAPINSVSSASMQIAAESDSESSESDQSGVFDAAHHDDKMSHQASFSRTAAGGSQAENEIKSEAVLRPATSNLVQVSYSGFKQPLNSEMQARTDIAGLHEEKQSIVWHEKVPFRQHFEKVTEAPSATGWSEGEVAVGKVPFKQSFDKAFEPSVEKVDHKSSTAVTRKILSEEEILQKDHYSAHAYDLKNLFYRQDQCSDSKADELLDMEKLLNPTVLGLYFGAKWFKYYNRFLLFCIIISYTSHFSFEF